MLVFRGIFQGRCLTLFELAAEVQVFPVLVRQTDQLFRNTLASRGRLLVKRKTEVGSYEGLTVRHDQQRKMHHGTTRGGEA